MTTELAILAEAVGQQLKENPCVLITAESCTGGGLAYWLTTIPGSSAWFEHGFITYSDTAKTRLLQVDSRILATHGAVSEQTACAMAEGALRYSDPDKTSISIAITGIAGPTGGTEQKPVGTVWIAFAIHHVKTKALHYLFAGDREAIRTNTIAMALKQLLVILKECS